MDRITGDTTVDIGGGKRGFRDRDAANGIVGTFVNAPWANGLQEEIATLIEAWLGPLKSADSTQLKQAIDKRITARIPDLSGVVPTARTVTATTPVQVNSAATATLAADLVLSILTATTSRAGSMSAADKAKLDGIAASATSPKINGSAAIGAETTYSRGDHVHPTDTSRAPLASPVLTGTPTAPTAAAATNNTQIATTAYVTTGLATKAAASHTHAVGDLSGVIPIANGGTGAATAALARNALGLGNTTAALPIANGGTGATTAALARTALGVPYALSSAANGYYTLPGGLIIQWGTVTVGIDSSLAFLFPIAFPTACYSLVANGSVKNVYAGGAAQTAATFSALSKTGATINNDCDAQGYRWIAIGV